MASASRYEYVRINPPSVRVLHFEPSPRELYDQDTVISGTLRTLNLDCAEAFDAISYACGEPKYEHPILVDKRVILVTKNCYDGLRHLRDQLVVRDVWVDAVSINAADNDERNEQLRLMTRIYGAARRVYIWLGPATPVCERALVWLNDASVAEHALLGARVALFPDFFRPAEVKRILPVFADVFRASE